MSLQPGSSTFHPLLITPLPCSVHLKHKDNFACCQKVLKTKQRGSEQSSALSRALEQLAPCCNRAQPPTRSSITTTLILHSQAALHDPQSGAGRGCRCHFSHLWLCSLLPARLQHNLLETFHKSWRNAGTNCFRNTASAARLRFCRAAIYALY